MNGFLLLKPVRMPNVSFAATADSAVHHLHHLSIRMLKHFKSTVNLDTKVSPCARVARQKRQ
jgi:hypothetical protein